ncbi:serine hydrolase domain-containing protein [Agromyces sp. NPDC049794]|uniref:serine hydrolase domain-containing protein n=1 Tax=unclassified Agromyces TaxID=2639701 RepID=UPI0033D34124
MPIRRPSLDALDGVLEGALAEGAYSAAVALVALDGQPRYRHAVGCIRSWDAPAVPADRAWPAANASTRFDLASVTKPIVAAALLSELEARGLGPELPVGQLLDEFRDPVLRSVTIAQLLSHTAGFPAEWTDREPDPGGARFRAAARPDASPRSTHRYSCVGYIWAGFVAEALAGAPLDEVVRSRVLDPLGMTQTCYRPDTNQRPAIAATEFQPERGLVHGEVHDETAWALGGVVGNAGLFGTAGDLLRFAEALRLGGRLDGRQVLSPTVAGALVTPVSVPGDPGYGQSLGTRLDEPWMRGLGPRTAGHTGFTGTGFVTEPGGRRSVVFLTNRVHPTRSSIELLALRGRVVDLAAGLGGTA